MPDLVLLARPTVGNLMCWAAETTLVAFALAVVALLGSRLRRIGPAARHVLWLVVLVKLMTPPLLYWPWSRAWTPPLSHSLASVPSDSNGDSAHHRGEGKTFPLDGDRRIVAGAVASVAVHENATRHRANDSPSTTETTGWPGSFVADSAVGYARVFIDRLGFLRRGLPFGFVCAWLAGSLTVALVQARRIIRFRRELRRTTPAPRWLLEEAARIGDRMSVRVPTIRVMNRPGTPLLWCLGRPLLLVPEGLLDSLEVERWRAILAHEFAHLRRGDPWVSRLELVAALTWWWNPLYWLARRRLDFEAELACDAWALWTLPDDRLGYAESLVRICTSLSSAGPPAPALGVAGNGRSFERRLVMILRERVSHRASVPCLVAALMLTALSLPSWTFAGASGSANVMPTDLANAPHLGPVKLDVVQVALADDDDDDAPKPAKKKKQTEPKPASKKEARAKVSDDDRDARVKQALGPDFEKKMEALGEKIGKEIEKRLGSGSAFEKKMEAFGEEMEKKFGPEFEKKMEAFGEDFEKKFGPEFEKKMEAFGEDFEKKFGPEFEKKMEAFGEEMKKKFGPDSDFTKEISTLGETLAKQFGPGSEFAEQMKDVEKTKIKTKQAASAKAKSTGTKPAKVSPSKSKRADLIDTLESRLDELKRELDRLKAERDDDNDSKS